MPQGFQIGLPQRLSDSSGTPANGWKIYTYATNSVTPKTTYSDGQLSSANVNPIITDSAGYFRMFLAQGETVKIVVYNASDVLQFTLDYLQPMIADPAAGSVTAVPTGGLVAWGTASAPTGFLLCDGSAVSRATYATLFGVISTTFGAGDGSTTFNVPDCRGRFVLGKAAAGTGSTLAGTGGSLDHTHTGPSHTHTTAVPITGWGGTQAAGVSPQGTMLASDGAVLNLTIAQTIQTITSSASGTGNTGTGNPAFIALNWIIKT